jgi:hypothetical protein
MNAPSVMIDRWPMTGPNATALVAAMLEISTSPVNTPTRTG